MPLTQQDLSLILRRIVHDLRGPLINLRISLEVLSSMEEPAEREKLGQEMDAELARLDMLIEDTARLAHAAQCQLADASLNAVLAQFVHQLEPACAARVLWQAEDGCRASVDPDKLVLLLGILLGQSMQRASQGSSLRVELARDGESFVIRFLDDGVLEAVNVDSNGRPKVDLKEAFANLVVEGHGGSLTRASTPGGTLAILRLPA